MRRIMDNFTFLYWNAIITIFDEAKINESV